MVGYPDTDPTDLTKWEDPELHDNLVSLVPKILRFPGGTNANWYEWDCDLFQAPNEADPSGNRGWQIDWLVNQMNKFDGWVAALPNRSLGYSDFRDFLLANPSVAPSIVLNLLCERVAPSCGLGAQSPDQWALGWMNQMVADGLSPTYIELGNEVNMLGQNGDMGDLGYLSRAQMIDEVIKAAHPWVRTGIVAAIPGTTGGDNWNSVMATSSFYDAVIHHQYGFGEAFGLNIGVDAESSPLADQAKAMLGAEGIIRGMLSRFQTDFPGKPLWVTEWNVSGGDTVPIFNSVSHALFLVTGWMEMLDHPQEIEMATVQTATTSYIIKAGGSFLGFRPAVYPLLGLGGAGGGRCYASSVPYALSYHRGILGF